MKQLTVVIPVRQGGNPEVTLRSLGRQTHQDFDVVVVQDEQGNANWARNRGLELVTTPLVLFSDDDIDWNPKALDWLHTALELHPAASYSYGAYEMGGRVQCNQEFDSRILKRRNFVSTMSMVRRSDFPGFDTALQRLQDWDVWLTMWKAGKFGVYCGQLIFTTEVRNGITKGGNITYDEALTILRRKHNL